MIESLLKRERIIVLAGLVCIIFLSWSYLLYLAKEMAGMDMPSSSLPVSDAPAGDMSMGEASIDDMSMEGMPMGASSMGDMPMSEASAGDGMSTESMPVDMSVPAVIPQLQAWQPREFLLMFVMWSVMMVAMMVPSAAPMILTFAAIDRKRPAEQGVVSTTSAFVLGYLLVWVTFSFTATIAQGLLHQAALLSPMMATTNSLLAALLLIVAGLYQWTPLKSACLHHCRSPFGFLLNEWRNGMGGALRMGLKHGTYCLGCCWSLMALLFVAGVMNILWIATLTILVLLEKVVPWGHHLSRLAGIVFICWGAWLAVTTIA